VVSTVTRNPFLALVTTSWDDGHPLDLRLAELLSRYGMPGTFYVPRDVRWSRMTESEIRRLSSRFELGGHTLHHVLLDRVADDKARNQLAGSRHWIEDVTGKACRIFCFPGGKFRPRQLSLARESGYQAVRTTELLSMHLPRRVNGLAVVPTTVQVFPHSPLAYGRNAIRRCSVWRLVGTGALLYGRDWLKLAHSLFDETLSHGGVFHLWGHSWEIEQEHQWERLEALLAIMASHRQKFTSVTNLELCANVD
jgi:peptidoglycan/xylan/chitin deacetylase (PgdA/CDA1 family)